MTPIPPTNLPSSLESDENIIDSTGVSNYNHLIEELSSFFDTNPFGRKIIKVNIGQVEKFEKKLENSSIRLKKAEYYRPFAFVTVMSKSDIHSKMSIAVGSAIERVLDRAFPQDLYANNSNVNIISPQRETKPDAQLYPQARREVRRRIPTVVVEVGVSETEIELLRDISDWFTIQRGNVVIEAAVAVKVKLGSRNGVEGPGLLSKKFTGAIFESYLRVARVDATRDGRQEGWRELVQRETIESIVVDKNGAFDHVELKADPVDVKLSALAHRGDRHQGITVPANLLSPDAENDDDIVLLNEDDIIRITQDVFWLHEDGVAEARAP